MCHLSLSAKVAQSHSVDQPCWVDWGILKLLWAAYRCLKAFLDIFAKFLTRNTTHSGLKVVTAACRTQPVATSNNSTLRRRSFTFHAWWSFSFIVQFAVWAYPVASSKCKWRSISCWELTEEGYRRLRRRRLISTRVAVTQRPKK